MSRHRRPRKVTVGTCIYPMYASQNPWPGLPGRLQQLADLIGDMAVQAEAQGGLDLAVLPEVAVNGGLEGDAPAVSFPLTGAVHDSMGAVARRHGCYVVVPMFLAEEGDDTGYSNACVLLDRAGDVAGIYRKVFPVSAYDDALLEGGVTPGTEFPVVECDFGRLGMQICFDGCFPEGWAALGAAGAELVVWPTMSPQTVRPALYAYEHGYYVVSSTWRNNATMFYPNGMVVDQIRDPERVLVRQLDLTYENIGWQPSLRDGEIFTETYGDAAGFDYSAAEDNGIFWSNDPARPIGQMVEELGLETIGQVMARNRALQDELRPGLVPGR